DTASGRMPGWRFPFAPQGVLLYKPRAMWIRKNGVTGWRQGEAPAGGLAAGKRVGHAFLTVALLLLVVAGGGCKKSAPAPLVLTPAPLETVARVLWLGKQRLATDTNAASVMGLLKLAGRPAPEDQI